MFFVSSSVHAQTIKRFQAVGGGVRDTADFSAGDPLLNANTYTFGGGATDVGVIVRHFELNTPGFGGVCPAINRLRYPSPGAIALRADNGGQISNVVNGNNSEDHSANALVFDQPVYFGLDVINLDFIGTSFSHCCGTCGSTGACHGDYIKIECYSGGVLMNLTAADYNIPANMVYLGTNRFEGNSVGADNLDVLGFIETSFKVDSVIIRQFSKGHCTVGNTAAAGNALVWRPYEIDCSSLTASFTANTVCQGTATSFDASGSTGAISSYEWDFNNDGITDQTTTIPTTTYTYSSSGTFTAELKVFAGSVCVDSTTVSVNVLVLPNITNITSTEPSCGVNDGTITFTFPDEPSRVSIEFSTMGNGGSANYDTYNTADNVGTYTITGLAPGTYDLWVRWGDDNCPVDLSDVTLNDNSVPVAAITTAPTGLCEDISYNWGTTTVAGETYSWDFGPDATPSSAIGAGPHSVSYGNMAPTDPNATWTVELVVTGSNGCKDTASLSRSVRAMPEATPTPTHTTCGLDNGEISFSVQQPPVTGIQFSLDGGSTWENL